MRHVRLVRLVRHVRHVRLVRHVRHVRHLTASLARTFLALLGACALGLSVSCENIERLDESPQVVRVEREKRPTRKPLEVEVPTMMRGTVASEAIILGYRDVVVRGFGLVVGLRGTGSRQLQTDVRAFMIQEMGRRGVGVPPLDEFTPDQLLDSLETAVVIVEGVVPAGAVAGTAFDVRVYAAPGTSTTSLEGGRLYSCDLRPGPLSTSNRQAAMIAIANGPVFVNPFAEPNRANVSRTAGRILDGGKVTRNMPLKLRLFNASHNRAATLQTAVNSSFPREPGQREATARGESGESLVIQIPPSFGNRSRDFIELLRHTSLSLDAPESIALQIRRSLLANPTEDEAAAWRWESLGVRVLPMIQDLYDHPEMRPRVAALRAGARLNDALAAQPLLILAREGSTNDRMGAIQLLGDMGLNPMIDKGLRDLLMDRDVDVRTEAFIALAKRRDPAIRSTPVMKKFELWSGPSKVPTVYVSQAGTPRIAIAGPELVKLDLPLTISIWSNRLMLKGDLGDEEVEVFYRPADGGQHIVSDGPVELLEFVRFLAHRTSVEDPRPGLDLAYGEVVGVLHELWKAKLIKVDFKAEQDRLLAAILRLENEEEDEERPEFSDPDFDFLDPENTEEVATTRDASLAPLDPVRPGGSQGVQTPKGGIVPR